MREAIAKFIGKVVTAAKGASKAARERQRKRAIEKLKNPTQKWPTF